MTGQGFAGRRSRVILATTVGLLVLSQLTGCANPDTPEIYAPARALAKSLGIGSIAHIVKTEHHNPGDPGPNAPVLEIAETGQVAKEEVVVERNMRKKGITYIAPFWSNNDAEHFLALTIDRIPVGGFYTFGARRDSLKFPEGGVVYIIAYAG